MRLGIFAALGLGACSPAGGGGVCVEAYDVLVATSDYSSAQVGGASFEGRTSLVGGVDLGRDPVLTVSAGRAFLVARDVGTLFELDPRCGKGIASTSALDPGRASTTNPQDVAVAADGTLVVTRFDVPSLLLVSPSGDATRVDLSAEDADGNPDMGAVRIAGGRAYVALDRLDANGYRSRQASRMAIVDVASRTLLGTVPLAGRNPFGPIAETAAGLLFLAAPGNFDQSAEPDAGIERFDTRTETTALVLTERALGGSAVEVAVDDAGACAVALLADPTPKNRTRAIAVPLDSLAVRELVGWTEGFDLRGLALGKKLVVGDRRLGPRGYPLHVFRREAGCSFAPEPDVFLPSPPVGVRTL